jgi:hypothetical protein
MASMTETVIKNNWGDFFESQPEYRLLWLELMIENPELRPLTLEQIKECHHEVQAELGKSDPWSFHYLRTAEPRQLVNKDLIQLEKRVAHLERENQEFKERLDTTVANLKYLLESARTG